MGYLDEVYTLMTRVANAKQKAGEALQHKSIAKGAMDGTLQFGCLVSKSIPIDMASTLARTFERTYASFVQTYLSVNNTIDIALDRTPSMFLKRFHKNIKLESVEKEVPFDSVTTPVDVYYETCVETDPEYDAMMERIYNGTTKAFLNVNENAMIVFNLNDTFNKGVYESHRESLVESLAGLDFYPFPNVGNSPFFEADRTPQEELALHAAKKQIEEPYAKQNAYDRAISTAVYGDKLKVPVMTDNDVKKSNDMQPYMMQVRLMAINDKNEFVQFMDFIIGVKVNLHPIESNEMIVNIQNTLQNNGKVFNFIRWTTGEKSLIKDLLLHIDDVKLDVANKAKGSSPWWMTLKKMKNTAAAQKSVLSRNTIVPQATIIVSAYEVDEIARVTGMNLRDVKVAERLMKSLFLMNFVIVDDGTRTVDVLYDNQGSYQTYALETLEREVSMSSNKIGKELTRMMSR